MLLLLVLFDLLDLLALPSMLQLKDLLTRAMQRAKVDTQVSASQVVSVANAFLQDLLEFHHVDARAASLREQILTIEVTRSSTGQFVSEREAQLLERITQKIPSSKIKKVRYKVVHHFARSEH